MHIFDSSLFGNDTFCYPYLIQLCTNGKVVITWNATDLGHMRELDIQCFHQQCWSLALRIRIQVLKF